MEISTILYLAFLILLLLDRKSRLIICGILLLIILPIIYSWDKVETILGIKKLRRRKELKLYDKFKENIKKEK